MSSESQPQWFKRPAGLWYRIEPAGDGTYWLVEYPWGQSIGRYRRIESARARIPPGLRCTRQAGTETYGPAEETLE